MAKIKEKECPIKKMAKYKPGQIITVNHNVYQVKDGSNIGWCDNCDLNEYYHNCENCSITFPNCIEKIGNSSYLKLIVPKKQSLCQSINPDN